MLSFLGLLERIYVLVYAFMPTRPYTAGEVTESRLLVEAANILDGGDESDDDIADFLMLGPTRRESACRSCP